MRAVVDDVWKQYKFKASLSWPTGQGKMFE